MKTTVGEINIALEAISGRSTTAEWITTKPENTAMETESESKRRDSQGKGQN